MDALKLSIDKNHYNGMPWIGCGKEFEVYFQVTYGHNIKTKAIKCIKNNARIRWDKSILETIRT